MAKIMRLPGNVENVLRMRQCDDNFNSFTTMLLLELLARFLLFLIVEIIFRGVVIAFVMVYLFLRFRDSGIRDKVIHKFYYGSYLGEGSIERVKIIGFAWILIILFAIAALLFHIFFGSHVPSGNENWN